MSEGVPKRKLHDKIEVMQTFAMESLGLANKKGQIIEVLRDDKYLVELKDISRPIVKVKKIQIIIHGHSLRGIS